MIAHSSFKCIHDDGC